MGPAVLVIFVFVGIVVIGLLIFGGWVIVSSLSLFGRAVGAITRTSLPTKPVAGLPPPHLMRCGHANCRADNLKNARFCRRCGKPFQFVIGEARGQRERNVVRRAAMW